MARYILVVDDEPQTVKLVRIALEREGFEVEEASNGAECLLAIGRHRPDLVILDVAMPVLDGFQTLRVIREKPETKDLPVLMLTARREDHDVLRGWAGGVDLYLTKPFQIDELLAATKRLVAATESPDLNEETEPSQA